MSKYDAMRIEIERPAKNTPRCEYHVRSRTFSKHFLADHITIMVTKDGDHAFFAEIAHHQRKVVKHFLTVGT